MQPPCGLRRRGLRILFLGLSNRRVDKETTACFQGFSVFSLCRKTWTSTMVFLRYILMARRYRQSTDLRPFGRLLFAVQQVGTLNRTID